MNDPQFTQAAFCDHANEVPTSFCRCPRTCYCRANTCKAQEKTKGIVPEWAGSEDFGGSDYDTGFETGWDRMMREQLEPPGIYAVKEHMMGINKKVDLEVKINPDNSISFNKEKLVNATVADLEHDLAVSQATYLTDSRTQPAPQTNDLPFVKDLVLTDIHERAEFGKSKYGTYLQPGNGRDALKDLYQEQLDALMYTRLLIFQRDGK